MPRVGQAGQTRIKAGKFRIPGNRGQARRPSVDMEALREQQAREEEEARFLEENQEMILEFDRLAQDVEQERQTAEERFLEENREMIQEFDRLAEVEEGRETRKNTRGNRGETVRPGTMCVAPSQSEPPGPDATGSITPGGGGSTKTANRDSWTTPSRPGVEATWVRGEGRGNTLDDPEGGNHIDEEADEEFLGNWDWGLGDKAFDETLL